MNHHLINLNIPYYIVDEPNIKNEPLIRYILKLLDCISYNFQIEDVIQLVKNSFFGFDNRDKDLFEKYVYKWDIKGFNKYRKEWTNSPLGYNSRNDEYIQDVLTRVNAIRENLYTSFERFMLLISQEEKKKIKHNIRWYATELYNYINEQKILERVLEKAKEISEKDTSEADRLLGLYQSIYSCLDEMVSVLGDEDEYSFDEFVQMIKMNINEIHTHSSKTTLDRVIVGSIDKVRFGDVKVLYIMGVNDGVFPRSAKETNYLGERDKQILNKSGVINFANTQEKRMFDEMVNFYTSLSIPKEKLVLTYYLSNRAFEKSNKSYGLDYIEELFDNFEEIIFENVKLDRIWRKEQGFENIVYCNDVEKQVLIDTYKNELEEKMQMFNKSSLSINEYQIDEKVLKELYKSNILYTSYSKIEEYIECEYKFFCDKFLKISTDEKAEFGDAQQGDLLHMILENTIDPVKDLISKYMDLNEEDFKQKFDDVVIESIDRCTNEYLQSQLVSDINDLTPSLQTKVEFLKMASYRALYSAKDLIKNSLFKPMYYELAISTTNEKDHIEPVKIIDKENGTNVVITGIVDRVDLYKASDGREYVKIVDYKSSNKEITIEKAKLGFNTQMLLYLFSIEENGIKDKDGNILVDKNQVVPAGTVYLTVSHKIENDKDDVKPKNAVVLNDISLEDFGKEANIKGKNDNRYVFSSFDDTSDLENYEQMKLDIKNKILDVVSNGMKKGKANTFKTLYTDKEIEKLKINPCTFCEYKVMCRNVKDAKWK